MARRGVLRGLVIVSALLSAIPALSAPATFVDSGEFTQVERPGEALAHADEAAGRLMAHTSLVAEEVPLVQILTFESRHARAYAWLTVRHVAALAAGTRYRARITLTIPEDGTPTVGREAGAVPYVPYKSKTRGNVHLHWEVGDGDDSSFASNCILTNDYPDPYVSNCPVKDGQVVLEASFSTYRDVGADHVDFLVQLWALTSLDARDESSIAEAAIVIRDVVVEPEA